MKRKRILRKKKLISKMERGILKKFKWGVHYALGLDTFYQRVCTSKNGVPQRYFSWYAVHFNPDTYELCECEGPMSTKEVAHRIANKCIDEEAELSMRMEDESFVDNLVTLIDASKKVIFSRNVFDYGNED